MCIELNKFESESVLLIQTFGIDNCSICMNFDVFSTGYLARMINGCPLECCVAAGHYAANYIIKQSGIQLKDQPTFKCICK